MIVNNLYYSIKPVVPRKMQIFLRRLIVKYKRRRHNLVWPIDPIAGLAPEDWRGWPEGKKFAFVLSHDVDTQKGHDAISSLLDIDKQHGFKSAFNIVPERYRVSLTTIKHIIEQGFEVNVHGLKHDGKLFKNRTIFEERASKINMYLQQWGATGFTAPSMICNLDWLHDLNIDHSTCTFDTDPFEPQQAPSRTIFPFIVPNQVNGKPLHVELPYTLAQDHGLFIILLEKDISIWKRKLSWIVERGGMVLLNTHPDYMNFKNNELGLEEYPHQLYRDFLSYVRSTYEGQYWHALPREVAAYIRQQAK